MSDPRRVVILGSTGSIGTQALEVAARNTEAFRIVGLTAGRSRLPLLAEQAHRFAVDIVGVPDEAAAEEIRERLGALDGGRPLPVIVSGSDANVKVAAWECDTVLNGLAGASGLEPTLAALEAGRTLALANKETLVMAGELVMAKALENNVSILPVDSEHSAIFQCLKGNRKKEMKTIFLTASGGPFRKRPFDTFKDISLKDALNHPTWNMGHKITIDSATLMNKGLEIIEAVHLFDIDHQQIQVLVHPQSIVHSMVGYKDGTVMAQMGLPDMKGAIAYAMSQPERLDLQMDFPDFTTLDSLTFEKPDIQKFPSLLFAFEACKQKGTLPAVMNAANEVAVRAFLEHRIGFLDIFRIISTTMEDHTRIDNPDLSVIIEADYWAREKAQAQIKK